MAGGCLTCLVRELLRLAFISGSPNLDFDFVAPKIAPPRTFPNYPSISNLIFLPRRVDLPYLAWSCPRSPGDVSSRPCLP